MRTLLSTALLSILCANTIAQAPGPSWVQFATGNSEPPLRRENPGTSDGTYMYVFGGKTGNSGGVALNDLWRFDGVAWTEMTTTGAAGSPPERDKAGVTWDFARNKLIVFGGQDGTGALLADTWEWDPGTNAWTNITSAGPAARRFTALSYDPATSGILMFGGLDAAGHLNDTWLLFSGTTWVQMAPTVVPSTRRQHHLVTRSDVGDVLLVGGQDDTLAAPGKWRRDTHSWNGADWTLIVTATQPQGVVANDATYDELRQRLVMPSGNGGIPANQFNGVSEFDTLTNDWVIRAGLGYYSRSFVAYVSALGKTFKVSGQGNGTPLLTYEYQSDVIADATSFGAGCIGLSGNVLTFDSNSAPWTGRTWTGTCSGMNGPSIAAILWGFSTAQDTSLAGLFGAPATCFRHVPIDVLDVGFAVAGTFDVVLALPNDPALSGFALSAQVAELDLTVNNLRTSNGLTMTIGVL